MYDDLPEVENRYAATSLLMMLEHVDALAVGQTIPDRLGVSGNVCYPTADAR